MKYLFLAGALFLVACNSHKKIVYNKTTPVTQQPVKTSDDIVYKPQKKESIVSYVNPTRAYINKYASMAMEEMRKFKIPASITLAQGILESGNGKSQLAAKSNNHFGIKCHSKWKGERVYHDDDAEGECFRKYKYVASSFQDHSLFLVTRMRYAQLFKLKQSDYKGWAVGLKRAGYATDPKYPSKLISFIEKYDLYKYDDLVLNKGNKTYSKVKQPLIKTVEKLPMPKKTTPVSRPSTVVNDGVHVVKKDDTLYAISEKYALSIDRLKTLNNLKNNTIHVGDVLKLGELSVKKDYYQVRKGDTLYAIAKKYNLTVAELKELNNFKADDLRIGQQLKIE